MSSASAHCPPGALCLQADVWGSCRTGLGPWSLGCQMSGQKCLRYFLGNRSPEGTNLPGATQQLKGGTSPTQRPPPEPELTCLRGGGGELTVGAWLQWTVGRAQNRPQRRDKAALCL